MTTPNRCAVCEVPASLKCMACKQVFYCGKEHQKIHWKKGHKAECKCYEVVKNDVLGRHLRASRDIKPGEIILRESPLIYGPKVACSPLCLGCHRTLPTPVGNNYYKCSKCGWPMCGTDCELSEHHVNECQLMESRKFRAKIDYSVQTGRKESAYCVILPLRCLLLKTRKPLDFEKFSELEDHLNERKNTPLYNVLRANLVTFVKTILALNESEDEILRVAAILDTNAFEVRQTGESRKVRAIYPMAAMFSHDCISNARHTFDEKMNIVFIAKTPIAKGEIICTSYTQPLWSTIMRRTHLSQAKCFDCTCRRCRDETELNTFAGSITCSHCKVGKVVSTNPMDNNACWKCQLCPHQLSAKQIHLGNAAIQKEIESLDKSSVKAFEEFLYRYRVTLHEKNTHILQVKYALSQLYGNAPNFSIHELNDAALKRKIELCQELLETADIFDGGWSIFRGNLLLDLQEAMVIQAKREFLCGLLTRDATQEKLLESMNLLKEAIDIMKLEPDMKQVLNDRTQQLAKELEVDE
ncbi:SET domain-containing protein SmydA-8 [Musca domestica]|uniref:SET domain-containing protein SmydA-8 n=2 Tax=Musca domestica TaxID=7370 RepID=A0A9J7CKM9_MUSDO|nr:SET domain-containing protein SmydA-8 [Musca domestica]